VWIKKGFAKANPKEYELNEIDVEEMKKDPLVKRKYNKNKMKSWENKYQIL